MNKSVYKMFREENGVTVLDLEITREGDKFSISESTRDIDRDDISLEQANQVFKSIGLSDDDQESLLAELDGEVIEVDVNDDIMDEFKDFFDFIDVVTSEIKLLGDK